MDELWKQTWSRADAVTLFGDAAVGALETLYGGIVRARSSLASVPDGTSLLIPPQRPAFPKLRACKTGPFAWVELDAALPTSLRFFLVDDAWQTARLGPDALTLALARAMPTLDDVSYVLDAAERLTGWFTLRDSAEEPPHVEGARIVFLAHRAVPDDVTVRVVVDTERLSVDVSVVSAPRGAR